MNIKENTSYSRVESLIPNLIVSVESRKGGVGKTTAALCLSRLLKKSGYAVLFLDLDFTGTNAAYAAYSKFWINDISVVQNEKDGNAQSKPCNLLQLFDQCYMSGKPIPKLQSSDEKNRLKSIWIR